MNKKILVIAPHGDDEVLGCGATIAKYKSRGFEIYRCIVTKPYIPDWQEDLVSNRPEEIKKAGQILGIKETILLGFKTACLDSVPKKELNAALAKIFKKVNPEVVFVPFYGDLSNDHKAVFESALVASRPKGRNYVKSIFCYETISETEWGQAPFQPNYYEDITSFLDKKIKAMKCYKSELRKLPHPRSIGGLKITAQKRGMEANLKAAEAFVLIRKING